MENIISQNNIEGLRPVAVFDSGVGGISVLREMVRIMPQEDFLYFGDSANAPYGTKSTEEVRELTIGHVKRFLSQGAKAVAIACNTATSAAVRVLREMYPSLPLVGIEPALKPAVESIKNPRVLVLGTPVTIREEKFRHLFLRFEDRAEIYPLPCPGLMEYVEEGRYDSDEIDGFLFELLRDYLNGRVNAVVLGCTHYPFVADSIARVMGPDVQIFDGALGTAKELKRRMAEAGLLKDKINQPGRVVFENSDLSSDKIKLCKRLFETD